MLFVVVSCGGTDAPRSAPTTQPTTTQTTTTQPTTTGNTAKAGLREWDGIAYPVWEPNAYAEPEALAGLADIAATGASTVSIIPTWYQTDEQSSIPERDPDQTPTDDSLRVAIRRAHELGMAVILKPHVDLYDDGDRANIIPVDTVKWFDRYRTIMVDYATLATDTGVEMMSVGTELAGTMTNSDEWRTTIERVRTAYSGPLTYAANFDSYDEVPFWSSLDYIGVDAYFELVDEPTTDVQMLIQAWRPHLDALEAFSTTAGRPILFTEAGFVSQSGTTTQPWNWEIGDTKSDAEQAAGYRSLFEAVANRPWLQGVQWWMWDDLASSGEDQSLDYTPHGKDAEQVLREWWTPT